MKYHNKNILCLEYDEYVDCFNSELYKKDKLRKKITVYGLGGNGRQVLIDYELLPPDRKQAVKEKYGNPYDYVAKQPLIDYVKINWDYQAERFYNDFVLPNRNRLPETYVTKYTKAATWLNTIQHFTTDKRSLKQDLNISIAAFWIMAGELMHSQDVALPTNERRLKDKLKQYKDEGLSCIVEGWRFGNDNSKKVKDKLSEALLVKLIAHPHKHDDTIIAAKYNEWAIKENRDTITAGTVGYRRKQTAIITTLTRDGSAINYNKFSKQIPRDRPSAPLLLINSDDNIIDLYFKEDGKNGVNPYYRATAYLVVDPFNDYILGYAIGNDNTIELIKEAYRNAIHHVKQLTGDTYLWHQIQTDHWAIDSKKEGVLATFFNKQAHFAPATIKVAQSKYIERTFGEVWHQQLKMFHNYAGYNITAKERMNPDAVQIAKKDYPNKDKAPVYIAQFIENMRQTVNPKTGLPRETEWLEAFKVSQKSQNRLIDTEKRLQLFGITHPYSNKITAAGIKVEINRQRLTYDIPDELYIANVNKSVQITYDPYDMSQVLVSDGKGLRFVTGEVERMPSALADFTEGSRTALNKKLDFKKKINSYVQDINLEIDATLKRAEIDANSFLQAGITVKEVSHRAQKAIGGYVHADEQTEEIFNWRTQL
jgi:hypothetical protein